MNKLTEWLSQFDDDEQERLIRYALDHIVPRMKKARAALAEPVADEPVAPINEGEAWSFCRKVISDGRDILAWHPDECYERQSARMDAQAAKRADELMAALRAYVDADRAQRVPLTDEQIDAVFNDFCGVNDHGVPYLRAYRPCFKDIVCAIERAHGIGAKP